MLLSLWYGFSSKHEKYMQTHKYYVKLLGKTFFSKNDTYEGSSYVLEQSQTSRHLFLSMLPLNFAFKSACDAHKNSFSGTPRCFKSDKSHELTVNELIAAAEIQVRASVIKSCFIRHIFICSNSTLNKWHHVRGGALKLELTEYGFCCCYEFHFRDSHISARVKPPFRPCDIVLVPLLEIFSSCWWLIDTIHLLAIPKSCTSFYV